MLFKSFEIDGKEYKAVLNASASVEAEEKLGQNPLNIILGIDDETLPSLKSMLIILHASLQKYHHGISLRDTYDLYDKFIDEGHQMSELLPIIIDILEVSGYFKKNKDDEEDEEEKNSVKGKK